jgi:hypothetical protein
MSCLRAYSQEELGKLLGSLPRASYQWELGTQNDGFLPVTYLIGYTNEQPEREASTPEIARQMIEPSAL